MEIEIAILVTGVLIMVGAIIAGGAIFAGVSLTPSKYALLNFN